MNIFRIDYSPSENGGQMVAQCRGGGGGGGG